VEFNVLMGHPPDVSDYTMTQNDGKHISVQRSHQERDLGIMIDSELNFSEHNFQCPSFCTETSYNAIFKI